jgi:hypothetical protein
MLVNTRAYVQMRGLMVVVAFVGSRAVLAGQSPRHKGRRQPHHVLFHSCAFDHAHLPPTHMTSDPSANSSHGSCSGSADGGVNQSLANGS